jgi:hypothetical protein
MKKEQPQKRRSRFLGIFALITIALGLYWALIQAPRDALQGDV